MEEFETEALEIQVWIFIQTGPNSSRTQTAIFNEFKGLGITPQKTAAAIASLINGNSRFVESEELTDGDRIFMVR